MGVVLALLHFASAVVIFIRALPATDYYLIGPMAFNFGMAIVTLLIAGSTQ